MEKEKRPKSMNIGDRIGQIRRLRGMNQSNLGKLLGITKQSVSQIERSREISDERLEEVAKALGVTAEGLKNYDEISILCRDFSKRNKSNMTNYILYNLPFLKTIEIFEKILDINKEKISYLQKEKK